MLRLFPAPLARLIPAAMANIEPTSSRPTATTASAAVFPAPNDALAPYAWREPALWLTSWAQRADIAPVAFTVAAAVLAGLSLMLLWRAQFALGLLCAVAFAVVEIAGAKLALCSNGRSMADQALAIALVLLMPPAWWGAWEHGLTAFGRPLEPVYAVMALGSAIGSFGAQQIIEATFRRRFAGLAMRRWKRIDSRVGLVTEGCGPSLAILAGSLVAGRPDSGLVLVAWWAIISLFYHAVRFAQASEQAMRGRPIVSGLDA